MSGPWQPPAPSLAALPVDRSKTDPKPAYYKLQFGDDVTGFSYYVRTLSVVIGRNCVSIDVGGGLWAARTRGRKPRMLQRIGVDLQITRCGEIPLHLPRESTLLRKLTDGAWCNVS